MKHPRLTFLAGFLSCVLVASFLQCVAASDGLEPAEAIKQFHLTEGLKIELVVAEPDVVDPVAIAWDEFGRMFVVEMRDYPNGPGEGKPFLSRVKLLEDKDGDGRYEKVTVFAEQLPFANGVLPWQGGVIVTAAPDIWFLKDSDGDGKADVKEKLFTGFKEGNPQLRVNHPTLGIDNWIYVANGLSGGEVSRADKEDSAKIPIPQMDFRFRPDRSEFEATAGNTQFGLTFDDFANRFMCSNRQHVAHVVLPDRYLKRNPFLGVAKTVLDIPDHGAAARIFPLATTRTTAVEHAGTFTAACGLVIYRGTALPQPYRGNSFICDPTGYFVHRDVLEPAGPTFVAKRAPEEARREFLASTDEWFRPVNLANGPDGALYVVDMYRENIEHPQYMPKGLAETLDLRRGDDRGRVWRITGKHITSATGPWPGRMETRELVKLFAHPDSWWRETAQRLLLDRQDHAAVDPLYELVRSAEGAATRVLALWTLRELRSLPDRELLRALKDPSPHVREHALRLMESRLKETSTFTVPLEMSSDPDMRVRFQAALTLGERATDRAERRHGREDPRVNPLAQIIRQDVNDPWVQIAVLSSAQGVAPELWLALGLEFRRDPSAAKIAFVGKLAAIIGARRDPEEIELFVGPFASHATPADAWWQLTAINGLADGLMPSGQKLKDVLAGLSDDARPAVLRIEQLVNEAAATARDSRRPESERVAAVRLAANAPYSELAPIFSELLGVLQPQEVQFAVVRALASMNDPGVGPLLLDGWASHSPLLRREVIEAMFGRRERIVQLLDAIEAGPLKAADLDLNRHQQLLNHSVKELKERAQKLFENEGTPNRKEVIESYRTTLTKTGDVSRGRELFKKNCATCHQIQGEGQRVGPELTGLRTRNKEALLMDVLDPNRALEPNYASYLVATKDGRVLSGIIAAETANSITLRRAEGVEDTLLRQDIEAIRAAGQSLMPEGLERQVGQAEMVDLIEFLKTVP